MKHPLHLLIFGFGYTGHAIAKAATAAGFAVTATSRTPASHPPEPNIAIIKFDEAEAALAAATHILATAAPGENGDPILLNYQSEIAAAPNLAWIGYLSTTGVYGNRDGGWVDEDTTPAPQSPRAHRRVAAEAAWSAFADRRAVDIFRLAGIYGPGRSMFDDLRECTARRVVKPGHLFGRTHRDDIAHGVLAAMQQTPPPGTRIFNFSDDEPAASADVVVEAARLLGIPPPQPTQYEGAAKKMTPMGTSFWAENRRVANAKTKAALGITWKYPTYREGLAAILAEERRQGRA
jgi:nucleoside-diphosphate-sugar epimerase